MKNFAAALPLALVLAGCMSTPGGEPPTQIDSSSYPGTSDWDNRAYVATDGRWRVVIDGQRMSFTDPSGAAATQATPPPGASLDVVRYEGPQFTLSITPAPCRIPGDDREYGETVELTIGANTLEGCGYNDASAAVGSTGNVVTDAPMGTAPATTTMGSISVPFRAVGNEPFWDLRILNGEMRFQEAGGQVVSETLPVAAAIAGGTRFGGQEIDLRVLDQSCSDQMSDRIYPTTVTVRTLSREWRGCGAPESYFVQGWESGVSPAAR